MTYQQYVKKQTTAELVRELKQLNEAIEVFSCFNSKDLILREHTETELAKRGVLK